MKRKSEALALSNKRQKIKNKNLPFIELLKTLRENLDQNLSLASCNDLLSNIIDIIESTGDILEEDMQEELIKLSDQIFTHLNNKLASAPKTPMEFKQWLSTQLSTEDVENEVKSILFKYDDITNAFICGRRLSAANLDLMLTLIAQATTIDPLAVIEELAIFNDCYFSGFNAQAISSLVARIARFSFKEELNAETINSILNSVSTLVERKELTGKIESKAITDLLEKFNSLVVTNKHIADCLHRIGDIAKKGYLTGAIESSLLTDLLNKFIPNQSDISFDIHRSLEGIVALNESGGLAGRIEPETLKILFAKCSCLSPKSTSNFHNGIGSLAQTNIAENNSAVLRSLEPLKILGIFSNCRPQTSAPLTPVLTP